MQIQKFAFFLSHPTGIFDPIYGSCPLTGAVGTIPQTGRHRESIPGPPDLRTDALPTALTKPPFVVLIPCGGIRTK